jgi:glycosyltransferase involved in cell wall biosynthesis
MVDGSMKLLFVADYLPLSGAHVLRIYDFVRFFKSSGVDVSIVSRVGVNEIFRVKAGENIDNIRVYRALSLDLRLGEAVLDIFQAVSTFLLCFLAILLNDADMVVISVPPGVPGIGGFFAAKILRRKVVYDVRDKWEEHSLYSEYWLVRRTAILYRKVFDILYKRANLVISVTPSLVNYLRSRGSQKVTLIPNGADVSLFRPRDSAEKTAIRSEFGIFDTDILLVYAGSIGAYYRPDIILRAIHYLMKTKYISNAKLIIMGNGISSKIREMLTLIEVLGLEHEAIFLGEQKREDVARILSGCDLGVVPYDDNPLWDSAYSTKFFEYCSAGLPVIVTVTRNSDLAKLVRKHEVGYVVDPLNVAQFAAAIKEFCSLNEDERKEMRDRARNLIVNSFDRGKIAGNFLETLQSALQ